MMGLVLPRPGHGLRKLLLVLALLAAADSAVARCLEAPPLRGVNLAGAEFNSRNLPGVMHQDYTYPRAADLTYFADKGATAIRLPVRWERLQPELFGELDEAELDAIGKTLAQARQRDLCLILDLHNYGTYWRDPLGSDDVPLSAFLDLWSRVAGTLDDPDHLALGLMNEPFALAVKAWAGFAQDTVTDLRDADVDHLILVSGGRWSGVHEWFKSGNARAFAGLSDPRQRTLIEVHQYANEGYSGVTPDCHPPRHFTDMFERIGEWARDNDQRLFLGEFGVAPSEPCLATLDAMLELVNDPTIWRGWAYWAAGHWWGDYFLSVHPDNGEDKPQMAVLEDYFNDWTCEHVTVARCPEPPTQVEVNGQDD